MKHLHAIVGSMNLDQLSVQISQLDESLDILEDHDSFLEDSYKNSHFSSIAARFDQYKVLLKSMEVLSLQSQNIWALVKSKSDQISSLEQDLKTFKKRLNNSMQA